MLRRRDKEILSERKVIAAGLIVIMIVQIVNIKLSNDAVMMGKQKAEYDAKIEKLKIENMILNDRLVKAKSLVTIEKWAYAHDMRPIQKVEWYK